MGLKKFQFVALVLMLFLKSSFQFNCSVTNKNFIVHYECGNVTGSINISIEDGRSVIVKCKGYVNEVAEFMPNLNESLLYRPIEMKLDKSCPFPKSLSDLKAKTIELSGFKYAYGQLGNLTFEMLNGLKELETLILVSDGIKFIAKNAFQGLSNLNTIDLSNNSISAITAETFQFNFYLSEIRIDNNLVELTLESECFAHKNVMNIVSVTHTHDDLNLSPHLFKNTTKVEQLLLTHNIIFNFKK